MNYPTPLKHHRTPLLTSLILISLSLMLIRIIPCTDKNEGLIFLDQETDSFSSVLQRQFQQRKMEKSGQCTCGATIRLPNSECLYECRSCHAKGVFLCHIVQDVSDPVMIRCRQCKQLYTMFDCPQCQGTGVIKGFKAGQLYGCLCGFTATFLTCNICTALICLPPKGNYQNTVIDCKRCHNRFKYNLCNACQQCNYLKPEDGMDKVRCFNEYCVNFNKQPQKRQEKVRIPFEGPKKQKKYQEESKDTKCKICHSSQATMINSSCFHLSACEKCVQQLSLNRCPVCSANGEYRKVKF